MADLRVAPITHLILRGHSHKGYLDIEMPGGTGHPASRAQAIQKQIARIHFALQNRQKNKNSHHSLRSKNHELARKRRAQFIRC